MKKILIAISFLFSIAAGNAQKMNNIFIIKLHSEINPQSERLMELALTEAEKQRADQIIIDMDTYGGALHNGDHIRTLLLDCKIPTTVWINKNAASAGALISIACDSIYMEEGANIGAATVVGADGQPVADKYQAYMRSIMRSTAQATHRNPSIAEGMVGFPVGTDSMTVGNVISYTAEEAIEHGYCNNKAHSVEEILELQEISAYKLSYFTLSATDHIINLFLEPWLRGILILLIIGGLLWELKAPGIGFPLGLAIISTALYFIPSYLNGLAQNWEIMVFIVGVLLLGLEIFVIPGFGVVGIAGIVLTFASLILVMLNNDFLDFSFVSSDEIYQSMFVVMSSMALSIVLLIIASKWIIRSKFFARVSLQTTMESGNGYTANLNPSSLIGLSGEAYTVLRPSGKVLIEGTMYDAYTTGEFIEKGDKILVTGETVNSLKVKKAS